MKMTMNAALLAAVFAAFGALPAQAQNTTVTASVNARAGLAPLFAVACDPVNFGVWRVPIRSGGATTLITLTVSANTAAGATTGTATGNTTNVSLNTDYDLPEAGICRVVGATTVSKTITTAITNNTNLGFIASNHESLATPSALAALSADLALAGTGVVIDTAGAGAFRVTGVLTIPATIVVGNYGGYQTGTGTTAGGATVSVTDTEFTGA
jgi:hypothetical protein